MATSYRSISTRSVTAAAIQSESTKTVATKNRSNIPVRSSRVLPPGTHKKAQLIIYNQNINTRRELLAKYQSTPTKLPVRQKGSGKQKRAKGSNEDKESWFCGSCKGNASSRSIECEGNCRKWFHPKCGGLTDLEFSDLAKDKLSV